MNRLRIVLALLVLPLLAGPTAVLAQPARPSSAVELLPADLFAPDWIQLGARETGGSSAAATAQFGGPHGGRIDLYVAVTPGLEDQESLRLFSDLLESYQRFYTDPERARTVAEVATPAVTDRCIAMQRFEGFELHYEFFPAGATRCILPNADMALLAYVAGDFGGMDGVRASDVVVAIVLDRISHDWQLLQSLTVPYKAT